MVAIPELIRAAVSALASFQSLWSSNFDGPAGQSVDPAQWNIITGVHYNNELQDYTTSPDNLRLSGSGTLQIIPRKSPSGAWTSARIESVASYTPAPNKVTRFSSLLRFGDAPQEQQQGIWPAFWMLGESSRHGTPWPECGELDIMERINGEKKGHGTPHCGPGDVPCGMMTKEVPLEDVGGWHFWVVEVDRRSPDWKEQAVVWYLDGKEYNRMTGERVGDEGIWKAIAQSPMYFVVNVAVGGNWPGPPNEQTVDGEKTMLEVKSITVTEA
ncbi:concanavalin A-like lectin/glucanase domain-containing protein [Staphylotrichum tortipilum]|uniref:Concanavalin A-like lectin/glucanase domain-containing protein n=1 Tax=Staphylotrichum tortipilum TaxID=2831512 RepID=A0AAN6MN97_9PEZI|nr:concanavalin A-like lectin/glucanase domain-containing protein [Staphylotrichum longicolle]